MASPKESAPPYEIVVVGEERAPFRDAYHAFLRWTWPQALLAIVGAFAGINLLFSFAFLATGGIANARPGSLLDAVAFSVQTLATIGYGYMYPTSPAAHALVWLEAVAGLLLTALATGAVFAKFSISGARIVFSHEAVVARVDGVPTLMFRLGNARSNRVAEATVRVVLVRTEKTAEGQTLYRMHDLKLARERSPALARSWTVLHPIDPTSPLHGYDAAALKAGEVELLVTLAGTDDTSLQPVHAGHTYFDHQILFGRRHVDVLTETPDGNMLLDLRHFHDHVDDGKPPPPPDLGTRGGTA